MYYPAAIEHLARIKNDFNNLMYQVISGQSKN